MIRYTDVLPIEVADELLELSVPLMTSLVVAGFPSPADDYLDEPIDLNKLVFARPSSTFLVRVAGDSMIEAGIRPGDLLVVDRAEQPSLGRIVIAVVNGDCTVKRLGRLPDGAMALLPENPKYQPVRLGPGVSIEMWGVVTYVLHDARKG